MMQDTFSDYQRDANEYYMLNKRVSEPICIILINDGDSGNSGYSMISIYLQHSMLWMQRLPQPLKTLQVGPYTRHC